MIFKNFVFGPIPIYLVSNETLEVKGLGEFLFFTIWTPQKFFKPIKVPRLGNFLTFQLIIWTSYDDDNPE